LQTDARTDDPHSRIATPTEQHAHAQILITTSRDPSSRLTQFAKEMRLVVPNAQRVNRCVRARLGGGGGRIPGSSPEKLP